MQMVPSNSLWIVRPKSNPTARIRLFCFPYAGGSAPVFHNWPKLLPDFVEMCAVQLPGRGNRLLEPPFTDLNSLISALIPIVSGLADKPFVFYGHSMGALTAFELARALRKQAAPFPSALILSGHRAPHAPDGKKPLHPLPEDEFLGELRRLNGTPREIFEHRELLELLIPVLRADFTICETYRYIEDEPLPCPMTVFGGLNDPDVAPGPLSEWRRHTTGDFRVKTFPGDHFFIQSAQSELLGDVSRVLTDLVIQ